MKTDQMLSVLNSEDLADGREKFEKNKTIFLLMF